MNKLHKNNAVFPQTVEVPAPLEVHPSVSPLAAELLMKAADRIHREPSSYAQEHCSMFWHPCGTACCILGHMRLACPTASAALYPDELGLTTDQFDSIFVISKWPRAFMKSVPHWDGSYPTCSASIGIARIEHFLRTGE